MQVFVELEDSCLTITSIKLFSKWQIFLNNLQRVFNYIYLTIQLFLSAEKTGLLFKGRFGAAVSLMSKTEQHCEAIS